MSKVIKIIVGLFVVVVIGVVVVISTIDINQYKGELIELVEEATGRKLQIGGDMEFGWSLIPTVVVKDVHFSNASWGSKPEMLKLNKFEIEVALLPLLSGSIQINRLILLAPDLLLETNKKGMGNWVFASKTATDDGADGSLPTIVVNEVHIENATITYKDGVSGQETTVVIDEITTESDGANDPLSLIMKVAYNKIPIQIKGSLGSLNQLSGNTAYPLDLMINISDSKVELKGHIAKPMDGKGLDIGVKFDADSLSDLSTLAGTDLPELGPIALSGKITDSQNSYAIKSMVLTVGNSDLSGDVIANFSAKRPAITAKLNSTMIDLIELAGDEEAPAKENKDRVFSDDPLVLQALKSVNANVTINAKQIITSSMVLADTNVTVSLKDGNLSVKPLSTLVAGSKLAGNIGLNASGKIAAFTTKLDITGLKPNQLTDLDGKLTGAKTDVHINVKGNGTSISQIMASLNGKLVVKVGEGRITDSVMAALGADVLAEAADMLNPFSKSSEGTELKCAVVNFDINQGIATTDQGIAISTKQINIIGSGTINLKTEGLDIGIKPEAKEGVGLSVGQLASLVRISGTLAEPKLTADAVAAVSKGLSAGAAIATGGLSLLAQGLLNRSTSDDDPCATALGQKPAAATPKTTTEAEPSTTDKAVDTIKDPGSAITDTFKGLFN